MTWRNEERISERMEHGEKKSEMRNLQIDECVCFSVCVRGQCRRTSDAGPQYRCGQVGRGIRPSSAPHTPIHTQKHLKHSYSTRVHGPTDGRTDKASKPLIELQVRNYKRVGERRGGKRRSPEYGDEEKASAFSFCVSHRFNSRLFLMQSGTSRKSTPLAGPNTPSKMSPSKMPLVLAS